MPGARRQGISTAFATRPATGIGDKKDLNFGSVSMVGHNVGPKRKSSKQKDGPQRRLTKAEPLAVLEPTLFMESVSGWLRAPESVLDSVFYTQTAGIFGRTHG